MPLSKEADSTTCPTDRSHQELLFQRQLDLELGIGTPFSIRRQQCSEVSVLIKHVKYCSIFLINFLKVHRPFPGAERKCCAQELLTLGSSHRLSLSGAEVFSGA